MDFFSNQGRADEAPFHLFIYFIGSKTAFPVEEWKEPYAIVRLLSVTIAEAIPVCKYSKSFSILPI